MRDRWNKDWQRDDDERLRTTEDYGDWAGTYNRNYGYSYTGDRTRDYDSDWERGPQRDWRGNYNRDYGYSYTGDPRRDNDPDWDRGYEYERGSDLAYRSFEPGSYTQEPSQRTVSGWWLITGPFSDVGPRGYRRRDERILEDVFERLTQYGQLDASEVEIEVNDGEVTLSGTVDTRRDKRAAEDMTESVRGVRDVHNRLRLRGRQGKKNRSEPQRRTDTWSEVVREGMTVAGSGGDAIGQVARVRDTDFLLDRSHGPDLYVPFEACQTIAGRQIVLNVSASQVDNQGWLLEEDARAVRVQ